MAQKRRESVRTIRQRILILCEGAKTEPNYFNSMKADIALEKRLSALRIHVHNTRKNTARELVQEAKAIKKEAVKERNPFDAVWVVFDKDGYTKHAEAFDMATGNGIQIAFSSISFEYWLLLHYEYTTTAFGKADDLIHHLKTNHMPDYIKTCDSYSCVKEKTRDAMRRAERARSQIRGGNPKGAKDYELNPFTNVDELVEFCSGQPKTDTDLSGRQ